MQVSVVYEEVSTGDTRESKCVVKSLALALGSIIVTARAVDTEGEVYSEDTVGVIGVMLR